MNGLTNQQGSLTAADTQEIPVFQNPIQEKVQFVTYKIRQGNLPLST